MANPAPQVAVLPHPDGSEISFGELSVRHDYLQVLKCLTLALIKCTKISNLAISSARLSSIACLVEGARTRLLACGYIIHYDQTENWKITNKIIVSLL